MNTLRSIFLLAAGLAIGLAIGVAIGMIAGWRSTAQATLDCTGATEDLLRSMHGAIERGHSDAVRVEVDSLLSGSALETYEGPAFTARMRKAAANMNSNSQH